MKTIQGGDLPGGQPPSGDGRTRVAVARLLLERGPVTAGEVATELELSAAAVRRHLDALIADGEVQTRQAPRRGPRMRGRPAKRFLLTDVGRIRFGHGYDDLAVAALRYLAETGGDAAVRQFAERRAAGLVEERRDEIAAAQTATERAGELAEALTAQGYAATTLSGGSGAQLCQHNCPVAHVAAEFPQLCEAETELFAEVLGTHVQRLATIARGDAMCTTHVPQDLPEQVRGRMTNNPMTTQMTNMTGPTTSVPNRRQPA